MYKAIFSDLDETLIVNHHVPMMNREAIKKARQKGVRFVVTTGRSHLMIQEILKEIELYDLEDEYSLCFNGGLIVENKDNKIVRFKGISFEKTKMLYEMALPYDVCVIVFTLDHCYIFRPDIAEVQRKIDQKANFTVIHDHDLSVLKDQKIAKVLYAKRDMDYLKMIEKEITPHLKGEVDLTYSSNRYLEINPYGVSKGEALKWLSNKLGIAVEDTIAIGDNYNDVPMFEVAGLSACVNSATGDIKDICDYVCHNDYDRGAVKEVIDTFIEGEKL